MFDRPGARIVGCLAVRVAWLLRRSLIGITVAGLVGVVFAVSSLASTGPPRIIPSCSGLAQSSVVYRAGSVVVYRDAVRGDGGPHDWACSSRPRRRPRRRGSGLRLAVGSLQVRWSVILSLTGRGWLTLRLQRGGGALVISLRPSRCADVITTRWSSPTSPTAARRRRRARRTSRFTSASCLPAMATGPLLSSGPSPHEARWSRSEPSRRATAEAPERSGSTPVTGKIDPGSVRLRGLKVSFTENGQHRTIRLGV